MIPGAVIRAIEVYRCVIYPLILRQLFIPEVMERFQGHIAHGTHGDDDSGFIHVEAW